MYFVDSHNIHTVYNMSLALGDTQHRPINISFSQDLISYVRYSKDKANEICDSVAFYFKETKSLDLGGVANRNLSNTGHQLIGMIHIL